MPKQPTLTDYDPFAQRWAEEVVCERHHRTTGKVVGEAWEKGRGLEVPPLWPQHPDQRQLGEWVEERDLAEYEKAWG